MSDQNKYNFTGRLTRDIQLSYTPNSKAVADVGVAIGRKYKDKDEVVFLDLQLWGSMAETWSKYFHKGSFVIASGRLSMDQWTDKDGQKRSKLRCVVDDFTFPPQQAAGGSKQSQNEQQQEEPAPQPWTPSGPERQGGPVPDEDIPW